MGAWHPKCIVLYLLPKGSSFSNVFEDNISEIFTCFTISGFQLPLLLFPLLAGFLGKTAIHACRKGFYSC